MALVAFADDDICGQNGEVGVKQGIRSVDDAMIRPQNLQQSSADVQSATVHCVSAISIVVLTQLT